jgi:hypothetical protein
LGDATNIDIVRIEWPSGTAQEFHDVAPRQFLTIKEPARLLASMTNGIPYFSVKGWSGFQYDIEASTNLVAWLTFDTLAITNLNGTALITDTNLVAFRCRFYRAVFR